MNTAIEDIKFNHKEGSVTLHFVDGRIVIMDHDHVRHLWCATVVRGVTK